MSSIRPIAFGVNYTPRAGWFHSWLDFDADQTARDLDAIAALGMDHIRIFPLWPLLQPNRTLIRQSAIDDVRRLVQLAHERGMSTWVDVLQGHLSSFDFLPSWTLTWHHDDLFTSERIRSGQAALVNELSTQLADEPGTAGICIGNEFPQFAAARHPEHSRVDTDGARRWLTEIFGAVDRRCACVHCFDDDLWFDATHPFIPPFATQFGDLTTVHSWVFAHVGPRYGKRHPALEVFARYLVELACAWNRYCNVPDRGVWLQEVGSPITCVTAEDAADFATATIRGVIDVPELTGITWWCSHDVSRKLADFPELEYSLGLIDSGGKVKPVGRAVAEFAHAVRSGDNIGTAGADSAERPVLDVPADPALRHEAGPQGDVFDTFQRIWTRDHVWPQLRVNHA